MSPAPNAYSYEHPRPAVAVDAVVLGLDPEQLRVLLIQRNLPPQDWALPGGFVHLDESLEDAARRELSEETGIGEVFLEQLYTFGAVHRDPRERVIAVAYYALVNLEEHRIQAATDAQDAAWFSLDDLPPLAFDHAEILQCAVDRLRGKVRYAPIGFELLPEKFTLKQLQTMYEMILDRPLDKRNFRRKILGWDLLLDLDETEKDVAHRAARLYRFDPERYKTLANQGFSFEI